ncbi:hypothetical protein [Methylobacterium sp. 37f]|uniref:hypothetical protein n=1 Tax=Methylobacterium sp. 37f TaxID=2817058 RepID=UPI001FFD0460|nr:hypothetical protein [Methylobacterium sp. 37f]MCK2055265.1 hypothetical protein [Methylobacterium sp. 37f]
MAATPQGTLRGLAAIAAGSAAAGFGWSAGRDLYRKGKDWVLPAIALAVVAGGSGYAAWNLSRGHGAPSVARVIGAALAAMGSLALCLFLIVGAGEPQPGRPAVGTGGMIGTALLIHTASAVIGLIVGLAQRGQRVRTYNLERANLDFMDANGIRDVGGREDTFIDASGNELKLDDVRRDAMVFRLPGRRGARAYIDLDACGRMVAYRPPP